jgi:glutamate racemase
MGGLTVRAAIARALPNESLVYFGDGKNVPYGPRPREEIVAFVDEAVGRLVDRGAKMIVVACNAATGAAIDSVRAKYDVPVIGMEPAVKPAAQTTRTGVIGVLATAAALDGALYKATSAAWRDKVRIIEAVGEGFVELVENDRESTPEAFAIVRRAVEPMLAAGADRIVLGCTHYPFLEAQILRVIEEFAAKNGSATETAPALVSAPPTPATATTPASAIAPSPAQIIDSAPAIARRVEQLLTEKDLHAAPQTHHVASTPPAHEFLTFAGDDYREHLIRKSAKATLM